MGEGPGLGHIIEGAPKNSAIKNNILMPYFLITAKKSCDEQNIKILSKDRIGKSVW